MWTIFSAQVMRSTDLQLQSLRNDVIWESILLGLFCDVACLARLRFLPSSTFKAIWTLLSWGEIWNWSRCKKSSPWTTHHDPIKNSPFTAHHSKVGQNKTGTSENVEKNSSNWRGVFWFFADFCVLRKWRWRTTFGYEVAICNWRTMAANSVFLAVSGLGNNDDHGSSTLFWRKRQKSYAIFPIWPQVARLPNSYWRIRWPLHLTAIFSSLDKDDNLEFKSCPCMMHTAAKL